MKGEYELVSHGHGGYRLFLVNLIYRTPHIHRDFEISWILNGEIHVSVGARSYALMENELFIASPYESHELRASSPVLILSLQVSPSFFSSYFHEIDRFAFASACVSPEAARIAREKLYRLATVYWQKPALYELDCAAQINSLFHGLFQHLPYTFHSEQELIRSRKNGDRMRRIVDYIDDHYGEKLLLSELAEKENLNLHYLSHLFQDRLGMPFQEYLSRLRCEQARKLLIMTDRTLLDIGMSCGFSDPKYFNRSFRQYYGCSPKEYRKRDSVAQLQPLQKPSLTTQDFLSPEDSLLLLQQIRQENL